MSNFLLYIMNIKAIHAVNDAVFALLETWTRLCLCDDLYTRKHWGKSACSFIGINWMLWLFFVRKNEKCLVHIYKRFAKVYNCAWQRKILPKETARGRGMTASLFTKVDTEITFLTLTKKNFPSQFSLRKNTSDYYLWIYWPPF